MAYKNIFNWPSIIILLLSGLLLLSSCAGLPVTGMVGGQPIDTRVDSEVARYYLGNYLAGNHSNPALDARIDSVYQRANSHLPDRSDLKHLSDQFSVDFAALYFADQIDRVPINRRFRSAFEQAYEYASKAFPEGQVKLPAGYDVLVVPTYMYKRLFAAGADMAVPRAALQKAGRGERCDGKTIVGARGVRLRNGWRAIRVVDGERDAVSTRRRPHLNVRGRCVAVKAHALFARHGHQRASHPALHRGVELAGANRSGLALVRTTLRTQARERREHPLRAILVRPLRSARKIGGVPGEAEIAIAFGRLEPLQRRALLVENEQTLVGGKVFGWLPTVETHALAFHGGPQLFRARTSNTSTMSSTMSGTLAPVALTASFQAPAGPEASPLARSDLRSRPRRRPSGDFGCQSPWADRVAASARRRRPGREACANAVTRSIRRSRPRYRPEKRFGLERERHLDFLARGGLLDLLPGSGHVTLEAHEVLGLGLDAAPCQPFLPLGARRGFQCGAAVARRVGEREHDVGELADVDGVVRLPQLDAPRRDRPGPLERQIPLIVETQLKESRIGVGLARRDRLNGRDVDQESRSSASAAWA